MKRTLIVNADDFGLSRGLDDGVVRAHREGILTSASLMVHQPAAAHAAQFAQTIDLGLHLDLGEWVFRGGEWIQQYERVSLQDRVAVEREIRRQLGLFEQLTGMQPSHLNSHQHIHLQEPLRSVAKQIADEVGVPLRGIARGFHYCGAFYGQSGRGFPCVDAISATSLVKLLATLPPGITELGCHPGNDDALDSVYCVERSIEVATLCDPRVRRAIEDAGIRLATFRELLGDAPTRRSGDHPRLVDVAPFGARES
jgi:predicted glycoside hydrolase/deacetylase ChbG (UPF0249 family)